MKRFLIRFVSVLICLFLAVDCAKPEPAVPEEPQEQTDPEEGQQEEEEQEEQEEEQEDDEGGDEQEEQEEDGDDEGDEGDGEDSAIEVLDPGATPQEHVVTPQHPELVHEVSYDDFYNAVQDELDEFGNIDYVIAQGNGTAWPLLLENGHIRFYQGNSKGGGYIRIRSHNGARLLSVEVGTATATKLAHSLDGKAAKSETRALAAGGRYLVENLENCTEVRIFCMGVNQNERWEMDYIYVKYQGGFVESDYFVPEQEYGPLVKARYPFTENFEEGFPTTEKPSYYKYGLTAGRENLQWSTWYGSFSWQKPIEGGQSAQLRVYQEEGDYEKPQFGHLKMEYFLKDLRKVSFKFYYSEFWNKATVSYCEFGSTEWKNPRQIALQNYSDRETVRDFEYVLDGGQPHDAKIRIEIDPETGFPSRDSYNFLFDCFRFE